MLPALALLGLCARAPAYDFAAVDALIRDSLPAFGDSVVVMIKRDDTLLYHNRQGNLDSLSKIGIASASKWISGAVILRLAEKGLLKLDESLGSRLPLFSQHGKGHITLRQCFSMTSGLFGGKEYEINPFMTLQRSVDSIAAGVPLAFAPGTRFAYEGAGMQAVARVAELAAGKPWAQVAREEILAPCGMDSTTYDDFGPLNPAVAGGIRTTARDYMRFLDMVQAGGMYRGMRVLTAASIQEMFQDQTHGAPIHYSPWPPGAWPDGKPPGYGFGCWAMMTHPQTGLEMEMASPGAFGTFPWADRCRRLQGIVLVDNPHEGRRAHVAALQLLSLVREEVGGCVVAGAGPEIKHGAQAKRQAAPDRPVLLFGMPGGDLRGADGRLAP